MTHEEHEALQEVWAERVADCQASGQTRPPWAAAHGVTVHQLAYGLRKFRAATQNSAPPAWVAWPSPTATNPGAPLIVRIGPAEIRVGPDVDPPLCQAVVRALSS